MLVCGGRKEVTEGRVDLQGGGTTDSRVNGDKGPRQNQASHAAGGATDVGSLLWDLTGKVGMEESFEMRASLKWAPSHLTYRW